MAGKEPYFLTFNKDYIFSGLIAIEEHFRNVKPEFDAGDLSCILKHAGSIWSHADEAQSHALIAEGEKSSRKFAELRDKIKEFSDKVQRGKITPEEGIKEIREIRAFFESFNKEYDISRCKTCGPIPEELEKIVKKLKQPSFSDLEEDMARKVINSLSEKYNVPPPKLEIVEECHKPEAGLYTPDTIKMCRAGINQRVLIHEMMHHIQYKTGKPLDEEEAERFALNELDRKTLYSQTAKYDGNGEKQMQSVKETAVILGADHIGYGIVQGIQYLDATYPGAVGGQNPSLLIDPIVTILGILGGLKLRDPWDILSLLLGSYISTDLWRVSAEATLAKPLRFVTVPTPSISASAVPTAVQATVTPLGTAPASKYMITA